MLIVDRYISELFSEEEALANMESSFKSAFHDMVSYGGKIWFLVACLNAEVKYFASAIIMLVAVAIGMVSLWSNQETACTIQTKLVVGIQIWWKR